MTAEICGIPIADIRRLIEEDPPEVVAIREYLGLEREKCSAGIDEVDAGQAVFLGDLLCAEMFLDRDRKISPTLHRGVIGNNHAFPTVDRADPRDNPRGRCLALVAVPGRKRRELEERATGIDEPGDALPGQELPAGPVLRHWLGRAAGSD